MDDLLNDFISECQEMLEALGSEIVAWEAEPGDRARLDAIFRFVHTVKGNCGFLDLPRLEALSHAAEDALADVRAGRRLADAHFVSAVLAIIDRIGELVCQLSSGPLPAGDDASLVAALTGAEVDAVATPGVSEEAGAGFARAAPQRAVRLSVDLLDRLMSGVSDLVLARNELARRMRETGADGALSEAFERVSSQIAEMREAITRTRMQRVESLFTGLPRMVRDLSRDLGKKVLTDIEGGDVELDREMIEMIRDPLTHIIRNAIDHGIEPSEQRLRLGKRDTGLLHVAARQSGNQILIEITDDGRGIDGERLGAKAVAAGLLTPSAAERLSEAAKLQLIFEPGLSTAEAVTAISGRGVGMDVVRANVERIGGVVELQSAPGRYTKVTMRVPLTLTIIPALTVSAGGQTFAIPRSAIEEIVRVGGQSVEIESVGGTALARIRGRRISLVDLPSVLGLASSEPARNLIVLRPAGSGTFALGVGDVHDHEELVVKPAAPAIMAVGLFAGTTLGNDGKPMLLLDASGLAAAGSVELGHGRFDQNAPAEQQPVARVRGLMFRELNGVGRAIILSAVERIEDVPASAVTCSGGLWRVALDGRILPLLGLTGAPETPRLRLFRLYDGARELAYAFADVIDIVDLPQAVTSVSSPGPVAGIFLLGDRQVELLDPLWLLEQAGPPAGSAAPARESPVLVIPDDDRWLETMLAPMAELAGYRVVRGGTEAERAAAVLHIIGESGSASGPEGKVLRLVSDSTPRSAHDIYRYDSAAILAALRARAGAAA